eukprot:8285885-Lingulodinium_polyedra.AAC.1
MGGSGGTAAKRRVPVTYAWRGWRLALASRVAWTLTALLCPAATPRKYMLDALIASRRNAPAT